MHVDTSNMHVGICDMHVGICDMSVTNVNMHFTYVNMHVHICNMHIDICNLHVDICNMHVDICDAVNSVALLTLFLYCPQDRPVTFHKRVWDLVYNNPREQVHSCVFSPVGVPRPRDTWALTVGKISHQAQRTSMVKKFHPLELFVSRALMQDAGNNLRQGVTQLSVKLRGRPARHARHSKVAPSLLFDPVDSPWQIAMGLDVSLGDAGACSV